MTHAEIRSALLHLAADDPNISSATIKRSLDLLTYLDIEELEVESVSADDWGAITVSFVASALPGLAVNGYDVTAYAADADHPVAKLVNAITCTYEADEVGAGEAETDEETA
jgi:hypothetical protein